MPSPTPPIKPAAAPAPLHIFKSGRHTAIGGQTLAFSESDLQATCAAYNPALHEAPLVIGHPRHDLPAYGWVTSLAFSDGGIDATPAQVNTDFADMVAAGAFKKISAAFYEPESPNNPVPGVYYLRHVGFLGAQPPAVKGLRQVAFAESEPGVVCFSEWGDRTNASLWRKLREWFIGKYGQEEADKVVSNWDVADLERGAQEEIAKAQAEAVAAVADTHADTPAFSEPQLNPKDTTTMTKEEIAALQAERDNLRKQLAAKKSAEIHAANVAFCEGIPANKLLPAHRPVAVAMLDNLAAQPGTVQFGEGDEQVPLADKFKAFLKGLPDTVQFGEIAINGNAAKTAEANPLLADAEARVGR